MNIVILDLEWNGAYSRRLHGFINEIIEFGAVKLDAQLNITDRFSCFVKPQVTKRSARLSRTSPTLRMRIFWTHARTCR